jgi:hypothetical protein
MNYMYLSTSDRNSEMMIAFSEAIDNSSMKSVGRATKTSGSPRTSSADHFGWYNVVDVDSLCGHFPQTFNNYIVLRFKNK